MSICYMYGFCSNLSIYLKKKERERERDLPTGN